MSNLLTYIEISLEEHEMEFFSPGGSTLRRIAEQLSIYFGLVEKEVSYLDFPDVRIGMDLLADEVVQKFSQREP